MVITHAARLTTWFVEVFSHRIEKYQKTLKYLGPTENP
jgi:hypothetical protein